MISTIEQRRLVKPLALTVLALGLVMASMGAAAQCAVGALNGSWDLFYGNSLVPSTQCQLRVRDDKKLTGQCRILDINTGFSDWIKISKGRLKVASNCSVTGRFTITFTPGFILAEDSDAQVELLVARMHTDGQAIDGVLIWQDPTSSDSNPVFNNAGFSAVRR